MSEEVKNDSVTETQPTEVQPVNDVPEQNTNLSTEASVTETPAVEVSATNETPAVETNVTPMDATPDMAVNTPPVMSQEPVMPTLNPTPTPEKKGGFAGIVEKIKSMGKTPTIIACVVIAILVVGIVVKVSTSTSKAVFTGQIKNIVKKVNKAVDGVEDFKKNFKLDEESLLVKGDIKFDTNVSSLGEEAQYLKDLALSGEFGVDLKNEKLYVGANIKGEKNDLGAKVLYEDAAAYIDATFLDKVVKVEGVEDIDFEEFRTYLETANESINETDLDVINDMASTIQKVLVKALDSKYLEKSSGKFEVDGKKVSATKNSLVLNKESLKDIIKTVCEELLNDDKFLSDFADTFEVEKGDVKEALKSLKDLAKDIELEDDILINIWTKGLLNDLVGFSVEVDDKEYFSYYENGKKAELIVDNHMKDSGKFKLVVNTEEVKKETNFTVKVNGEKIASGTIRELSNEKIDFDISVSSGEDEYKLSVYLTCKDTKKSISGEYKFKVNMNDEYVEVSGSYGIESGSLEGFDTSDAVSYDELDEEELIENLTKTIEEDKVLNNLLGESLEDMEEDMLDLNYNNMAEVNSVSELKKVLAKSKLTVLYVGEESYSSYSNSDAYDLLDALKDAQYDLDFYSYAMKPSYFNDEAKELLKDVNYSCKTNATTEEPNVPENNETTTTPEENTNTETDTKDETTDNNTTVDNTPAQPLCAELPAIYLIKDGKVVKAFRGTLTYSELETALKDLGM